jgi:hypothetical protein
MTPPTPSLPPVVESAERPAAKAPLVTGYGDEGAEMLAARFISERMDRFEPWLHARGVKSSFFQCWIETQQWRAQNVLDAPEKASAEKGRDSLTAGFSRATTQ